ncbi:MAG TPA: hypothetical protein VGW34_06630 [Allosphingosinicella sp.]|nr:hypothetical protein [Allosphingosinicella sp.]
MRRRVAIMMLGLGLGLGACDAGGGAGEAPSDQAPDNRAAAAAAAGPGAEAGNSLASGGGQGGLGGLGACPFRETSDWHGSIESGRLLVNGKVDLLMAGFKPTLTRRPSAPPGTIAFDLALVAEAGAAVQDRPRYEATGSPRYQRAEIWCGGKRIAEIDMVLVAD